MQLNLQTDYALRILIYLAMRPNTPVTVQEICDFYALSRNHLLKVARKLAVEGLILTVRGKGGGVRLAPGAGEVKVGDVVRRIEPRLAVVECLGAPHDGECAVEGVCRIKQLFRRATLAFLSVLDEMTIAEMMKHGDELEELLRHPPARHSTQTRRINAS